MPVTPARQPNQAYANQILEQAILDYKSTDFIKNPLWIEFIVLSLLQPLCYKWFGITAVKNKKKEEEKT